MWNLKIKGLKKAQKIISISKKTKEDLIKYFNIKPSKIKVIHLGIDEKFKPIINLQKLNSFATKNNLPRSNKYILYVGSSVKRKNVDKIIMAFNKLKRVGHKNLKLLLITSLSDEIKKLIAKYKLNEEIYIRSNVEDWELVYFYNIASVFVFPSLYEGFGFPPLEAMACGCPVICSNISSLPEVVGNATLMINPNNIDDLVQAIITVLNNDDIRKTLIKKGFDQVKKFSWEKTAQEVLKVYEKI